MVNEIVRDLELLEQAEKAAQNEDPQTIAARNTIQRRFSMQGVRNMFTRIITRVITKMRQVRISRPTLPHTLLPKISAITIALIAFAFIGTGVATLVHNSGTALAPASQSSTEDTTEVQTSEPKSAYIATIPASPTNTNQGTETPAIEKTRVIARLEQTPAQPVPEPTPSEQSQVTPESPTEVAPPAATPTTPSAPASAGLLSGVVDLTQKIITTVTSLLN